MILVKKTVCSKRKYLDLCQNIKNRFATYLNIIENNKYTLFLLLNKSFEAIFISLPKEEEIGCCIRLKKNKYSLNMIITNL